MRIVAVVQARMGSARLPGKMLADIGGRPALAHVLTRAAAITPLDDVILAIPESPEDDRLERVGEGCGVRVIRGDRDDVLSRYWTAAAASGADAVIRVTGDCPLLDPAIASLVVRRFLEGDVDYVSNTQPPTFPDGYDTEVMSVQSLESAWREAVDRFEREHVTPFIWRRRNQFRVANVVARIDRSLVRLTLDTADDLERIRRIWSRLGTHPTFGLDEVVSLLDDDPALLADVSIPIRAAVH